MPPPTLPEELYTLSPVYQSGYVEGFEDMKRATIKRLQKMIQEVEKLEAYSMSTATVHLA